MWDEWSNSLHCFVFFHCEFIKCVFKLLAGKDATPHWLHLLELSPLCILLKCILKWIVQEDGLSQYSHFPTLTVNFHILFWNGIKISSTIITFHFFTQPFVRVALDCCYSIKRNLMQLAQLIQVIATCTSHAVQCNYHNTIIFLQVWHWIREVFADQPGGQVSQQGNGCLGEESSKFPRPKI